MCIVVKIHGGRYSQWEILKCYSYPCSPFLVMVVEKSFLGLSAVLVCILQDPYSKTIFMLIVLANAYIF